MEHAWLWQAPTPDPRIQGETTTEAEDIMLAVELRVLSQIHALWGPVVRCRALQRDWKALGLWNQIWAWNPSSTSEQE